MSNKSSQRHFDTILHALSHYAEATPHFTVYTWVDINNRETAKLTYKELNDESNSVAAHLLKQGCKRGDRVMIAYPFGLEFLAGIVGAMKIGLVPCSIYPPNPKNLKAEMPRFEGFVKDAGATVALTTTVFARAMKAAGLMFRTGINKWIGTNTLSKVSKSQLKEIKKHRYSGKDVAFIQYTSGSTGHPKGVVIRHDALVENCKVIGSVSGAGPSSTLVLWLPQYHDMGLIGGFMTSLYTSVHFIAASPLDFILRPMLWSEMVESYKADFTTAPNFAYQLLIKRLKQSDRRADWSHLRRAYFGAEPTRAVVIEDVVKVLKVKRENIYNLYGLAESVAYLTGGQATANAEGLVSCGAAESDTVKLRIVKEGKVVPDGDVGTIWANSVVRLASGYLGQTEATKSTFHNILSGEEGLWLDTGDLGMVSNGQLYVTGREKDIIIVGGKNYYPTDVESSIEQNFHDIIRPGRTAAFQVSDDAIGVTTEARDVKSVVQTGVEKEIVDHILQVHGLIAQVVLVLVPGAAPKTTSGKLKRSEIKRRTLQKDWKAKLVLLRNEQELVIKSRRRSSALELRFSSLGLNHDDDFVSDEFYRRLSSASPQMPMIEQGALVEGRPEAARKVCPMTIGLRQGTACPFEKAGGLSFFSNRDSLTYEHGCLTETATIDYKGMLSKLEALEKRLNEGEITRDFDLGESVFADHRFWTKVPGFKPLKYGSGLDTASHAEYRSVIDKMFSNVSKIDSLRKDVGYLLRNEKEGLTGETIRAWVMGTVFRMFGGRSLSKPELTELLSLQIRFFDMTMRTTTNSQDEITLELKSKFLGIVMNNMGIAVQHASANLDFIMVAGKQLATTLNICLALQFCQNDFHDGRNFRIDESNVRQFVWECCRLFPTVTMVPWREGDERHVIVIAMCGRDKSLWGDDVESFRPTRRSLEHYESNSCFFAEQAGSYKCPAKHFALDVACAFMLEAQGIGWERPAINSYDTRPYFDDIKLVRKRHVAVIGGGVAGLICALRLAQRNVKVTILERNEMIGGHARHTEMDGGHVRNPAFGTFIANNWPNLMALTKELDIETVRLCAVGEGRDQFSLDGRSIPEVPEEETMRFLVDMTNVYRTQSPKKMTIGEYLESRGYSEEFVVYFILGRVINFFAGQTIQGYLDYPLDLFAWFVVGVFSSDPHSDLLRLRNKEYMRAFEDRLLSLGVTILTHASPTITSRNAHGVAIETGIEGGEPLLVDKVVLAVPPNAAAKVVNRVVSPRERLLVDFDCPLETVVLHQDSKWVGKSTSSEAAIIACLPTGGGLLPSREDTIPITSSLESDKDRKTRLYATYAYNSYKTLDISGPTEEMSFTHTAITLKSVELREILLDGQGQNHTFYAGGWTRGMMLHEDALVSGIEVANALLRSFNHKGFPVLEREAPLSVSSSRSISRSNEIVSTSRASNSEDIFQSVLGEGYDPLGTWAANGLTSVKSAELVSRIQDELHVEVPLNFNELYRTPMEFGAFLGKSETSLFTKVIRAGMDADRRQNLSGLSLGILQCLGIIMILLLLLVALIPSFWLGHELSKVSRDFEIGMSAEYGFFFWLPVLIPVSSLSFTLIVICCKVLLVGVYRTEEICFHSGQYFRWWLMDRILDLWEFVVGQFIMDTRLLWIVYKLLGARIDPSVSVDTFIREFDLVTIGPRTKVEHSLTCRVFRPWAEEESPVVAFLPIRIGSDCSVSGMVSPGCQIGDRCKVESLSAVAEGSQIPDGAIARGTPAYNAGSTNMDDENSPTFDWWLDALKVVWLAAEGLIFFGLFIVSQILCEDILALSWRYSLLLYGLVVFILTSVLGVFVSVILKWTLIGRRSPNSGKAENTWKRFAYWACDCHFRLTLVTLWPFNGASKFWVLVLKLHGLDVDFLTGINGTHTFLPSKVDCIKIRNSFLSVASYDLDAGNGMIEIIDSSIGYSARLHSGVKVVRSLVTPRTTVRESIYDSNQKKNDDSLAWRVVESVIAEMVLGGLSCLIFLAFIPTYEILSAVGDSDSSIAVALCGFCVAFVVHETIFNALASATEAATIHAPPRIQRSMFLAYIVHCWCSRTWTFWFLLHGTPFFKYWLKIMGAQVEGEVWVFGGELYELRKLHFLGKRVLLDQCTFHSHFYVFGDNVVVNDTYIRGLSHPGCYAYGGADIPEGEHGPYKVFHGHVSADGTGLE